MYKVFVKDGARKALRRLPAQDVNRILRSLTALSDQPRALECIKLEGYPHAYRLRAGDYRILYTIENGTQQVTVYRIAHRREAYR